MGNRASLYEGSASPSHAVYRSVQGKSLDARVSEESYLPMPSTMRKSLLQNKRFRHILPVKEVEEMRELEDTHVEEEDQRSEIEFKVVEEELGLYDQAERTDELELARNMNEEIKKLTSSEESVKVKCHVEPIVTILSSENKPFQSTSFTKYSEETNDKTENSKVLSKSPNTTNRKYSLMEMRTGLTKSNFTLELEQRLRQSKLMLGFDADLNNLREFSYKMGSYESKNTEDSPKKDIAKIDREHSVGKGLEKVCLKEPLQYCAQSCQILGLCSVRGPEVFPKQLTAEPSIFKDELARKFEVETLINNIEHIKHHHKKDGCDCEHCMLAYLTEMEPPDLYDSEISKIKKTRNPSISSSSCRRNRGRNETLRLVESQSRGKSIETSCKGQSTIGTCLDDTSSKSTLTASSFDADCTNRRIKRTFRRHNLQTKQVFKSSRKMHQDQLKTDLSSVIRVCKSEKSLSGTPKETFQIQNAECERATTKLTKGRIQYFPPSTSISSARSSLSSIMSYRRVRQIFQTIIEKNRIRKRRAKININKFKEMEELGLGEVKNNRWYPSDSKTVSIWNDFHQSVHGIQAEFKKYPKTSKKQL